MQHRIIEIFSKCPSLLSFSSFLLFFTFLYFVCCCFFFASYWRCLLLLLCRCPPLISSFSMSSWRQLCPTTSFRYPADCPSAFVCRPPVVRTNVGCLTGCLLSARPLLGRRLSSGPSLFGGRLSDVYVRGHRLSLSRRSAGSRLLLGCLRSADSVVVTIHWL